MSQATPTRPLGEAARTVPVDACRSPWPQSRWRALPSLRTLTALCDLAMRWLIGTHSAALGARLRWNGFRSAYVQTAAGRLRYFEHRAPKPGPTWVFVHGIASQATDWTPLLRRVARRGGRVLALDLPGHGASDTLPRGAGPEVLQSAVNEAMELLLGPGETCKAVANSMGGLGAIRFAQGHPRRVEQLILISPLGAPMSDTQRRGVLDRFVLDSHARALGFVDRLFVNGFNRTAWLPRFCTDALHAVMRQSYALAISAVLRQPHLQALVHHVRTHPLLEEDDLKELPPTLLIWGAKDQFLPEACADFFQRGLPDAVVHRPADYRHVPFLDRADHLETLIQGWVRDREASATSSPRCAGAGLPDAGRAT
ncbi:MAG TPA: alpha/beta fold hydrolase [Myxococcota bacterium]|nr:alpha/beta fold hydrolase [Myxococcota bacterium]